MATITLDLASDTHAGSVPKLEAENQLLTGTTVGGRLKPIWAGNESVPIGAGTQRGQKWEWNGIDWSKYEDTITIDGDPTGATASDAAFAAAIAAGGAGKVYRFAPGKYRFNAPWGQLPNGCAVVGPTRGMSRGGHIFSGLTDGAEIQIYGTGDFCHMGIGTIVAGLSFYYPEQAKTSAEFVGGQPKQYGYLFVFGPNQHGASLHCITAVNPYKLCYFNDAHGWDLDTIWAYPLFEGLNIGHVADVGRLHKVHFNPATDHETFAPDGDDTLQAWVQANGRGWIVQGIQMLNSTDCHIIGYNIGVDFSDESSIRSTYGVLVYGEAKGIDFESCNDTIKVEANNALAFFKFADGYIIPPNNGYGVRFFDSAVPTVMQERPQIELSSIDAWSGTPGMDRFIWQLAGSYGVCKFTSGSAHHFQNQMALQASDTGVIVIGSDVHTPSGATRSLNSSSTGVLLDRAQLVLGATTAAPVPPGAKAAMSAGKLPYSDGAGAYSQTTITTDGSSLSSVAKINGANVIAPTQGTDLTDADQTLAIGTAANYRMVASTTTATRNKTLGVTGATDGACITLAIYAQGNNVVVKDDAGTTLYTVTAGAAQVVDCRYDGSTSHYKLAGWKPIQ